MYRSITNVQMAYQIMVFPILDIAEERFQSDPHRDPLEHGPRSMKTCIQELVRDAQVHPGQDDEHGEFPQRNPIRLSEDELEALGKIARERGLPFNPQKRVYQFVELLPRMEAQHQDVMRRYGEIIRQNMIDAGQLRSRDEIEEEIRQRQEKWRSKSSGEDPEQQK